jgi:hypothetical protein
MFEYEEYWADHRLIVYQPFGEKNTWAYQIERWAIERFMVVTGGGGYTDSGVAIAEGRKALFKNLIHSFNWKAKR